jgi:hypothetical protein
VVAGEAELSKEVASRERLMAGVAERAPARRLIRKSPSYREGLLNPLVPTFVELQ